MKNKEIQIVMADDHQMIIHSLAKMLEQNERMKVVGMVPDGNKLLQYLNGHGTEVDVVILDLHMPQLDGLTIIPTIKGRFSHLRVVVLSMYYTPQIVEQVKAAGADTFVHKADEVDVLCKRIEEVVQGRKIFPSYQATHTAYTNEIAEDAFMKIAFLSEREKQVAQYIKNGLTTPKIAKLLYLSEYTVDTHRKNILKKNSN